MEHEIETIVSRLKTSLERTYGSRLRGLYVYGSFARGDQRPGSDLDVAMILDDFERPWIEIQRTSHVVAELSLECGRTISLIPVRATDWAEREKPLIRNIQREGVAV